MTGCWTVWCHHFYVDAVQKGRGGMCMFHRDDCVADLSRLSSDSGGPACGSVQFSSDAQSCPTLWDPVDCSTPGFPVHYQLMNLLKLMSIESVMPSNRLILCRPLLLLLQSFPASGSLLMSQFFTSGGQSIRVSASASVLPMNIQDWFPVYQVILNVWMSL